MVNPAPSRSQSARRPQPCCTHTRVRRPAASLQPLRASNPAEAGRVASIKTQRKSNGGRNQQAPSYAARRSWARRPGRTPQRAKETRLTQPLAVREVHNNEVGLHDGDPEGGSQRQPLDLGHRSYDTHDQQGNENAPDLHVVGMMRVLFSDMMPLLCDAKERKKEDPDDVDEVVTAANVAMIPIGKKVQ